MQRWSPPGAQRIGQGYLWEGQFGGSEANAAVSLAKLGNPVSYVSRIPQNVVGDACLRQLRSFGIDVSHECAGASAWARTISNPASGRVMEKCGFVDTGVEVLCPNLKIGSDLPVRVMKKVFQ